MSRFYITTAIPYANGAPHIGHAYERIATDAIQRFMRLDGRETLFVTGVDEYGLKVQQTAAREGVTPQAFVDRVAAEFEAMGELLNARADDIVRTTQPRNARAAQEIWRRMAANGDVYLSTYSGWYSVRDEAYFDESELTPGPDGAKLAPTGAPVDWVEEESWFFRLSAYADRLLAHYEAHPEFVTPEKYRNEIVAFVKRGLSDLSISRAGLSWGVPVPDDPKHVMYVWVDALTNYITATGFPDDGPRAKFWPADAHVIGKDITRFHAIYWPAFLMSAKLPLPRQIVVHGFLFNRGEKMSKSVGNVVGPASLVAAYGLDPVRYFFLREVPFGQDGNYSHEAIVNRLNADLANDIGNLAQRSLSMIARNCAAAAAGSTRSQAGARGPRDARARRLALRRNAPAHGELPHPPLRRRCLRRHCRGEPLFRQRRALEAQQDRSRAHAPRALCDGRGPADRRDPPPADHACKHGEAARPPGRARGRAIVRGAGDRRGRGPARSAASARAGQGVAGAGADLPTLRRARGGGAVTLIDSHCHLDFPDFGGELDAVVERARAAGVERMITIGTRVEKAARAIEIAERYASVYFTIGTHPHEAGSELAADFERCSGSPRIPTRRHRRGRPRLSLQLRAPDVAKRVFRGQIALARELGLPLVVHTRDAEEDTAAILKDEMGQGRFTALLHCFTSSRAARLDGA